MTNNQIKKTNTYKYEYIYIYIYILRLSTTKKQKKKIINNKKMKLLFTYQKHETFLGNNVSGKFGMK